MYVKDTDKYVSTNGRSQIVATYYLPQNTEVKGIVQISHGMCEYIERYEGTESIDRLTEAGWIVAGNDHAGHGYSAENSEDLGFFSEKDGWLVLIEDVYAMTKRLKTRFPHLPVILWGHSMGSFIAREVLCRYGQEYKAAILCGTAGPNPAAGAGIVLAKLTSLLKGSHYRSALLNRMAFGSYTSHFAGQTPYDWLSQDKQVVDRYAQDPFCTYRFTAAGFRDLFTLVQKVGSRKWADSVPRDLPMLLIAGEDDPVGAYGKGVTTVYQRLKDAGCSHVTIILYPGFRHEIHNEIGRDQVYHDLLQFLDGLGCSSVSRASTDNAVKENIDDSRKSRDYIEH